MKKFYTTILTTCILFAFAQAAVADTYKAWGSVSFMYSPNPMIDSNETVEVTSDSIFFSSATWGDGRFGIADGEGTMAMDNHRGGISNYAATISGSVDKGYVITLPSVMGGTVITVSFDFEEYEAVSIQTLASNQTDDNVPVYNLSGARVDASYKGIVIKNGKKILQK